MSVQTRIMSIALMVFDIVDGNSPTHQDAESEQRGHIKLIDENPASKSCDWQSNDDDDDSAHYRPHFPSADSNPPRWPGRTMPGPLGKPRPLRTPPGSLRTDRSRYAGFMEKGINEGEDARMEL